MIKAVFFDIDGTLVSFTTHRIPPSTQKALHALRDKGILLFIATGRPPCNVSFLKNCIDLAFDGYVMMNGQYCTVKDEVIRESTLPRAALKAVLPYLEKEQIACEFVELEKNFINLANERAIQIASLIRLPDPRTMVEDVSRALTEPIYQLSAYVTPEEEPGLLAHLPGCRTARWHDSFTDVIPADGGKTVGMDCVLSHFGLTPKECMAFGDGGNDLDMLKHAGIGIAMGNAIEQAKAAADYITTHVDDDGIWNALKHFEIL